MSGITLTLPTLSTIALTHLSTHYRYIHYPHPPIHPLPTHTTPLYMPLSTIALTYPPTTHPYHTIHCRYYSPTIQPPIPKSPKPPHAKFCGGIYDGMMAANSGLADFLACSAADSSPVIVFITKLFVMDRHTLPQYQTRWVWHGPQCRDGSVCSTGHWQKQK